MLSNIHFNGLSVCPITTPEGLLHYYDHFNRWHTCFCTEKACAIPTVEDALEYVRLKSVHHDLWIENDVESRLKLRKYLVYDSRYDWRPRKTGSEGHVGLVSPTGEQLLPECFHDVFTQFDAINRKPHFIPVSDGEAWALVSLSEPPVLMTGFIYDRIVPERWDGRIFFVRDRDTMKWGALSTECSTVNVNAPFRDRLAGITHLMPAIADDIYEDQLMTEEEPTTFFMTRVGDKIGILTDWGYSDIVYDTYETNADKFSFRLIRNDRKRAKRVDFYHPDGKIRRRKKSQTPGSE